MTLQQLEKNTPQITQINTDKFMKGNIVVYNKFEGK